MITLPRITNDNLYFNSLTSRGSAGWALGVLLTGFYVVLYWFPRYIDGGVRLLDPLARALAGQPADRWFPAWRDHSCD